MNHYNLKNLFKVALISSAIASMGSAHAATEIGNATANVIKPITISAVGDLVFGDLTVPDTGIGGTVVISDAGAATHTDDVTEVPGGTFSAATFTLTGGDSESFSVTLPSSATLTGPGSMIVNAFTSSLGASGTLDGSGDGALSVGATLIVTAGQAAGAYTGTFDVTVEYN